MDTLRGVSVVGRGVPAAAGADEQTRPNPAVSTMIDGRHESMRLESFHALGGVRSGR